MAHLHPVYDTNDPFVVDVDSSLITYSSEKVPVLIQMDHNSERYTFEMSRYVDGHDMSKCDLVQVHYINISSENTRIKQTGIYTATDLKVSENNENKVTWTWLVSQNATQYVGSLNFAVRFACTSGSKIEYSWNTRVYSSIPVLVSIGNESVIVNQYEDTLQQWYLELLSAGTSGVNIVVEAKNEALAEINDAATTTVNAAIENAKTQVVELSSDEIIEAVRQDVLVTSREEIIEDVLSRIPIYNGEVIE